EFANWVLRTSRKPNRPLAVASATAFIGTLSGRHLCGPSESGTHLYIACIGQTAIGKDRPLECVKLAMRAVGFKTLAQTVRFKSDSALEVVLASNPCCVSIIDEIGDKLGRITNRRTSTHETGLKDLLLELFNDKVVYETAARAQMAPVDIERPAFSI